MVTARAAFSAAMWSSQVILAETEPGSLLYQLGEIGNLQLELVDGVSGSRLLLVCCIHHLPQLLYLLQMAQRTQVQNEAFYAGYHTCLRELMVPLSSWESFKAVVTLAELATISALSSRHFCISLFSLSWDLLRVWWSFSYSTRNFSRL